MSEVFFEIITFLSKEFKSEQRSDLIRKFDLTIKFQWDRDFIEFRIEFSSEAKQIEIVYF